MRDRIRFGRGGGWQRRAETDTCSSVVLNPAALRSGVGGRIVYVGTMREFELGVFIFVILCYCWV